MNIPLFKIYWDEDDVEAVTESIKRGMNWAAGPNIEEFEKLIAEYLGKKYVVVFNSGTSALYSALNAYEIKEGDEVIVPSFTFIATANAPLLVGAKPVFADIEEETYGLDAQDVEKKITSQTKAIIPMHYGGFVCRDIKKLQDLAKKHNLLLIEDAAESFGAKLDEQIAGTFGDSAMISFCQTKVFTTGEGGCIVTDSQDIYEKLKLIRAHGRAESRDYVQAGHNFRMPDMIAGLGASQIKKVDNLIDVRRYKAGYMTKILKEMNLEDIIIPQVSDNIFHVYQEYPIRVKSGKKTRDALKKYLTEKGIGTRISFPSIHLTHYYRNVLGYNDSLPMTEKIESQALSLPIYPDLTEQEIRYIAESIKEFYEKR